MRARIIAFYLPQFHPTKNNDIWWGKGFTEWTNVGKAKPLYKGHYQPKVPADLGYYDLRLPEIREAQAQLAKQAGIEGFCYYHYWFGNKKKELDKPFNEVLRLGKPDFPFCLCWANESWNQKFWNLDGKISKKNLIQQIYDSPQGHEEHFYHLLPAFKDKRYIKVDGKLLFCIYKPLDFEKVSSFIHQWNKLALENGLNGFYFVGQTYHTKEIETILSFGFDAVNIIRLFDYYENLSWINKKLISFYRHLLRRPLITKYSKTSKKFIGDNEYGENIFPTLIPNWDHTPRSGIGGYVIEGSNPQLFREHAKDALKVVTKKENQHKIIFLKSWNEWGEGNYMEPDLKYGCQYIKILKSLL